MVDDLKKKKQDGKRIALGQKHEVAYLKKIANEQLAHLKSPCGTGRCSVKKLQRICKALIKSLNKKK